MKAKTALTELKKVLKGVTFVNANFNDPHEPLPTKTTEVHDFVVGCTKLYMDTWVIPPLKRAMAELENELSKRKKKR